MPSEDERFTRLPTGFVFKGKSGHRYILISRIGAGGMGAVYEAESEVTKRRYAVKCEPKRTHRLKYKLSMEKFVYNFVKSPHLPRYQDCGQFRDFGWIAMQLVGPSLREKLKEAPGKKFSVTTCLKIAIQVLEGLRVLHDRGFVHRDLKPDNLALCREHPRRTVFILDAGIARQYKNVDGVPHRPRPNLRFKGTKTYAPLALHKGQEYGPKDDLESWLYILAMFSTGSLPWQQKTKDEAALIRDKEECRGRPREIFKETDLSELLCLIWNYVTGLRYEDPVDYNYLRQLLNIALTGLNGENTRFDWEKEDATQQGSSKP